MPDHIKIIQNMAYIQCNSCIQDYKKTFCLFCMSLSVVFPFEPFCKYEIGSVILIYYYNIH